MINAIKLFAIGIMFGIAVIIPGVSGGTIAVVFNIYDRLLAVITPSVTQNFIAMEILAAAWNWKLLQA